MTVISLSSYRKTIAPPALPPSPKPELPWHIGEALWVLKQAAKMENQLLNAWETKFVTSMVTLRYDATAKQNACLKAIGDKVEAEIKRQKPSSDPPPAA